MALPPPPAEVPATTHGPLYGVEPEFAVDGHPVWDEIKPRPGKPGFTKSEFRKPHEMDVHYLRWLYRVRQDAGVPMRVISDARTSGGAKKSAHFRRPCRAVDLQVYNAAERAMIELAAIKHGCVRWGTYRGKVGAKGNDQGGLHLDASEDHPMPRNWTRYNA